MSEKLTRQSAKDKVYGTSLSDIVDQLFDQHEDETAQLRMEITELRRIVAERNEKIKEIEEEWYKADEQARQFFAKMSEMQDQLTFPDLIVTACRRGFIEDFEWYGRAEPNSTYNVFLIKQKGE